MFKYLILVAFFAVVTVNAAPARSANDEEYKIVPILSSETNKRDDGSYDVHYESGDGSSRKEEATVVDAGTEDEALEVKGSYKYINEDGAEVEVFYTAGVNGFVPYGSIINPEISAVAEAAKDLPKFDPEFEKEKRNKDKKNYDN